MSCRISSCGQVVTIGNSWLRGCAFESQHQILGLEIGSNLTLDNVLVVKIQSCLKGKQCVIIKSDIQYIFFIGKIICYCEISFKSKCRINKFLFTAFINLSLFKKTFCPGIRNEFSFCKKVLSKFISLGLVTLSSTYTHIISQTFGGSCTLGADLRYLVTMTPI